VLYRVLFHHFERFLALEKRLSANGTPLGEATLDEMETAWQSLKKDRP